MPPSARPPTLQIGSFDQITSRSRLRITTETSAKAKGAARMVIELLSVAATMTQSVPYLGAISAALTEFAKIQDEVDTCKDEWRIAVSDAHQINTLIMQFHGDCVHSGRGEGAFSENLKSAFIYLERVLMDTVDVLLKCRIDSPTDIKGRIRLYTRRSDLTRLVRECSANMGKALQVFNTTLQVNQLLLLEDIRDAVRETAQPIHAPLSPGSPSSPSNLPAFGLPGQAIARLPASPTIFFGREHELAHIVRTITQQDPARIAVLGPGGIGKTSVALAALHHPDVKAVYGERRLFLSCEPHTTTDGVLRELARMLGLPADAEGSLHDRLHSALGSTSSIICFDNFETPWEADTANLENLIHEFASLPSIGIMITSRLMDTPLIRWSYPPLQPLAPLDLNHALEIWDAICYSHDDYACKLVEAVDRVPLAVTLLARLARNEAAEVIWARWKFENIALVRSVGKNHRLNNVGVSIELSLRALGDSSAVDLLRVVSIFPKGLRDRYIPYWEKAFRGHLRVRSAINLLKQYSLIQTVEQMKHESADAIGGVRVLSPIRHHMLQRYPMPDRLLLCLADIFCDMEGRRCPRNLDNAVAYLEMGLTRSAIRERCLQAIAHSDKSTCYAFYTIKFLVFALEIARLHGSSAERALCHRLAVIWRRKREYEKARSLLCEAIRCDQRARNTTDEVADWAELAWVNIDAATHAADPDASAESLTQAQMALEMLINLRSRFPYLDGLDPSKLQQAITERRRVMIRAPQDRVHDTRAFGPFSVEPVFGGSAGAIVRITEFSMPV